MWCRIHAWLPSFCLLSVADLLAKRRDSSRREMLDVGRLTCSALSIDLMAKMALRSVRDFCIFERAIKKPHKH